LLESIGSTIDVLYRVYNIMIIAYILTSWLPNVRDSKIGEFLGKLVEPYLTPFRKIIPPIGGVIDLSPIVALLALNFVVLGLKEVIFFILRPFV
jgi:YggT family protein